MMRITNEIGGKLYELIPDVSVEGVCEGCAFRVGDGECNMEQIHRDWCKSCVCAKLHGIWKEVKNG